MSDQDPQYRADEKVATIALNRPERMNGLSRNLEAEIHRGFHLTQIFITQPRQYPLHFRSGESQWLA
jgi:hypothetical protein